MGTPMQEVKKLRSREGGIMWAHVGKFSSPLDCPGARRVLVRGPLAGGIARARTAAGSHRPEHAERPARAARDAVRARGTRPGAGSLHRRPRGASAPLAACLTAATPTTGDR